MVIFGFVLDLCAPSELEIFSINFGWFGLLSLSDLWLLLLLRLLVLDSLLSLTFGHLLKEILQFIVLSSCSF